MCLFFFPILFIFSSLDFFFQDHSLLINNMIIIILNFSNNINILCYIFLYFFHVFVFIFSIFSVFSIFTLYLDYFFNLSIILVEKKVTFNVTLFQIIILNFLTFSKILFLITSYCYTLCFLQKTHL